jgi:hypothetical protein
MGRREYIIKKLVLPPFLFYWPWDRDPSNKYNIYRTIPS